MTAIQLIILLLRNADQIRDLIKLIGEVISQHQGSDFETLSVEARNERIQQLASASAECYPALAARLQAESRSFLDLIKIIIENKDQIMELIQFVMDLIDSFKGDPTSVGNGPMSGTSMRPVTQIPPAVQGGGEEADQS